MKKIIFVFMALLIFMQVSVIAVDETTVTISDMSPVAPVQGDTITISAVCAVNGIPTPEKRVTLMIYSGTAPTKSSVISLNQGISDINGIVEFSAGTRESDKFSNGTYNILLGCDNVVAASTFFLKPLSDPSVSDYSFSLKKNGVLSGSVQPSNSADFRGFTYTLKTTPKNGLITGYSNADLSYDWSYTPQPDYIGTDYFEVEVVGLSGIKYVSRVDITVIENDEIEFDVNFYHLENGGKQKLSTPKEGNTLIEVNAKTSKSKSFCFLTAEYSKEGNITQLKFGGTYSLEADESRVFSTELLTLNKENKIKVFFWEDLNSLKPLNIHELKNANYEEDHINYIKVKADYDGASIYWQETANATKYTLYKNDTVIYSGLNCSFFDTDLKSGDSYAYKVEATVSGISKFYDYFAFLKIPDGAMLDFNSTLNTKLLSFAEGVGGDSVTTLTTANGIVCREIQPNNYLYLNVDDLYMHAGDYEATLFIDYLDNGTMPMKIEYASTNGSNEITFERTNTNTFKTARFEISNAKFNNSLSFSSDLRIIGEGAKISRTSVTKVYNRGASAKLLQQPQVNRMQVYLSRNTWVNNMQTIDNAGSIGVVLDDSFKDVNDREYCINLYYLDNGTNYINLNYKDIYGASKTIAVKKTNTNSIMNKYINISDVVLNKSVDGYDFTVTATGETSIKEIGVIRGNSPDIGACYEFSNPDKASRISAVLNDTNSATETYTTKAQIGDSWTRQLTYTAAKRFLYFKVDSEYVKNTDRNIKIVVTYYGDSADPMLLEYQGVSSTYQQLLMNKSKTDSFTTYEFDLNDAAFNKGQNNGADFRISSSTLGTTLNISKIEVINCNTSELPIGNGEIQVKYLKKDGFEGKTLTGYQGWFGATGDGSPINAWKHWSANIAPSPGYDTQKFELYPDMSEYGQNSLYQTGYVNLGDGTPATLFSSWDTDVINTHFRWMREYNIDGAAVQRFVSSLRNSNSNRQITGILNKIKRASQENNREFYVMYDISGSTTAAFESTIKNDWSSANMKEIIESSQYMKHNGKPVVSIWGVGFQADDPNRYPGSPDDWKRIVKWFHDRGCFVIGGVPAYWRSGINDANPAFRADDFMMFDMISPWTIGRFQNNVDAQTFAQDTISKDMDYCKANNVLYLPVVFPGFAWSNWNDPNPSAKNKIKRNAGSFLWQQVNQVYELQKSKLKTKTFYLAMFDEYDEGTALMKAASDSSVTPVDQYFLNLSEDGTYVSSDFYLRLVGEIGKILKGHTTITPSVPVKTSEGPVYFRTGFSDNDPTIEQTNHKISSLNVINANSVIPAFGTGLGTSLAPREKIGFANSVGALKVSGTQGSGSSANAYFNVCAVDIPVKQGMILNYKFKPENEYGRYVAIDLQFSDNTYLRNILSEAHPRAGRGTVGVWNDISYNIGALMSGKTIKKVIVGYDNSSTAAGEYSALIDNLSIEIR